MRWFKKLENKPPKKLVYKSYEVGKTQTKIIFEDGREVLNWNFGVIKDSGIVTSLQIIRQNSEWWINTNVQCKNILIVNSEDGTHLSTEVGFIKSVLILDTESHIISRMELESE